mmetsp:Transcript_17212/g.23777  ORF Transcript_17212/g.23777 Transcript_17212/m.23777 type:complete len:235 (+) Transcript_17212:131-835(+)|eukprot:CAMPEP_0196571680 /NCGR_PEP_ID=MMETSP1081-20130531/1820_1 /TAXON_ID=36882 /ORGANISM="Pyramimonas amylifera, Strain CCMP720" /LENGTH=234 /DNA_ID=CAMNT_0041888713 /DNA_START=131 /DNA_END=835 /DNA_ORIENTATION=+
MSSFSVINQARPCGKTVAGTALNRNRQVGLSWKLVCGSRPRQNVNARFLCQASDSEKDVSSVSTSTSLPKESEETVAKGDDPGNLIDPADGSVAYGAALGDSDVVSKNLGLFKSGRASEVMNGRAAMVGFTAALVNEIISGNSLFNQMFNVRDVGIREIFYPKVGLFLIPVTVVVVILSSLSPQARGRKDNGLDVSPEDFGPFTSMAETTNGRAAMIGLVALFVVESITGSALF